MMANFLQQIFARLAAVGDRPVIREIKDGNFQTISGVQLLKKIESIRSQVRGSGLQPGDRCGLLGANSIEWAAFDLALMAEGVVVVPLYSRQEPKELAAMLRDCQARVLFAENLQLGQQIVSDTDVHLLALNENSGVAATSDRTPDSVSINENQLASIIYTSGTSGEAKGVCLNFSSVTFMIGCTSERLDQLMARPLSKEVADRVFHYLPFNFAGSWIVLLTCLARGSVLTLSADLNKLADEIALSAPDYFLNVPTLLERIRRGVLEKISSGPKFVLGIFSRAHDSWSVHKSGRGDWRSAFRVALGNLLIFKRIRARLGPNLRALICGSAPLSVETQEFFSMLGIPVLQVYGLTETTAICTMDDPRVPTESGYVGVAIRGTEMKIGENEEILVRGPHIFTGYWQRPEETAKALRDGWFHTGDQGCVNVRGNWQIVGRLKNLLILNSGHNVAPEPIEDKIAALLPASIQVVVVGNGRGYLCALLAGAIERAAVQLAIDSVNKEMPHYRQVRNFTVLDSIFAAENGLLTANGKIRRDAINRRFQDEIDSMYVAVLSREIGA